MKDCDENNDVFKCNIWTSAEGERTGTIYLTRDQYNAIKYASNVENWHDMIDEGYSGDFGVYCECLE